MIVQSDRSVLGLFLPDGALEWFDVVQGEKDGQEVRLVLEEKNIPPAEVAHKKLLSKGFTDITIADFPIRGKSAHLTFRRRRWHVEETGKLVARDITLVFPGTQLEKAFADFLKEGS